MQKKSPFEIEKIRAKLAKNKNYKNLIKTYTKRASEIKDFNSSDFWDTLHSKSSAEIIKNPMEKDRTRIVRDLIKGNNINVLNLGFGSASLEEYFLKDNLDKKIKWSGIEISSEAVKNARKKFKKGTFKLGNIYELGISSNKFDYVIAMEVLEHIKPSKIFKVLSEINRIVKPGKFFIASVPLNENLEQMIKKGENPNGHLRVYTEDLIKAELKIAGFEILKEKKLYAFHNFYKLKKLIAGNLLRGKYNYNNVIVVAQKLIT